LTEVDDGAMSALTDRWWREIWQDAALDAVDELLTDPFVRHTSLGTLVSPRAEYKAVLADLQRTLYRPETVVDDRAVSGDRVWTRATSRGLNKETGELAVVTWLVVQRIEGGRIAEHWVMTLRGVSWTV
jgi:ketosteroid isomerase-like protein